MNRAAAALLLQMLTALHVDAAIADDACDNLFIVVPRKDGRPLLLRLKY